MLTAAHFAIHTETHSSPYYSSFVVSFVELFAGFTFILHIITSICIYCKVRDAYIQSQISVCVWSVNVYTNYVNENFVFAHTVRCWFIYLYIDIHIYFSVAAAAVVASSSSCLFYFFFIHLFIVSTPFYPRNDSQ